MGQLRVPRTDDNFIRTYTGIPFWPLDPDSAEVRIEDIAHHLALINRFAGATYQPYSVAEHSVRVSVVAERMVIDRIGGGAQAPLARNAALWGLLHDATEAYLVDVPRPVKHSDGMLAYRGYEELLEYTIAAAFYLPFPIPAVVKEADLVMCETEKRDLMRNSRPNRGIERLPETICPWSWMDAETRFLKRFVELSGGK